MFQPLAEAFAHRDPSASVLIVTGAQKVDSDPLPDSIDFVKLPSIRSSASLASLQPVRGSGYAWRGLWAIREALLHETARAFDPHLLIGDNEPNGMLGELARSLKLVREQTPAAKTVLGTFDFLGDRDGVHERWNQEGGMAALERYDRILVFGQQEIFDPATAYDFPESARNKTRFPGYLVRNPSTQEHAVRAKWRAEPSQPFVVIAAGGGEDGHHLLNAAMDAASSFPEARILVVTGPLMAESDRADLHTRDIGSNVLLVNSVSELSTIIAAADVVVIKGGYNSVAEAVRAGKRPIIVPRDDGWTEQRQRAVRFAELGLAKVILPSELSSDRLAGEIRSALALDASPPNLMRTDGIERAVDELVSLALPPDQRWRPRSLVAATLIPDRA